MPPIMPHPTRQVLTDDEFDTYGDGFPGPLSKDDRTFAMLGHLVAFAGLVVPFGNVLGPLGVWLAKRDTSDFVADHALESLNFQITMTIASLVAILLCFVLIGFVLVPILGIVWLVLTISAGLKANNGEPYAYPFTLRLVE